MARRVLFIVRVLAAVHFRYLSVVNIIILCRWSYYHPHTFSIPFNM